MPCNMVHAHISLVKCFAKESSMKADLAVDALVVVVEDQQAEVRVLLLHHVYHQDLTASCASRHSWRNPESEFRLPPIQAAAQDRCKHIGACDIRMPQSYHMHIYLKAAEVGIASDGLLTSSLLIFFATTSVARPMMPFQWFCRVKFCAHTDSDQLGGETPANVSTSWFNITAATWPSMQKRRSAV